MTLCEPRSTTHCGRALLALALLSTLGACMAPPVLKPLPKPDLDAALALYPPNTRRIEIEAEDGDKLRGVFVPAGENAPVVLHLLGSAQSPAFLALPLDAITWNLADHGYASLMVDYAGIGASSGEAHADNLGRDAWLMWSKALELANGAPQRVVVRATSLGAIACALALERGARPGAILLVAPVFPDSVVGRFARDNFGVLAQAFAALAYRPVARVDVLRQLRESGAPLAARVFREDNWVTKNEFGELKDAVLSAPQHSWFEQDGDHVGGVVFSTTLSDAERAWLASIEGLAPVVSRNVEAAPAELSDAARRALEQDAAASARFAELAQRFALVRAEHLAAAALEHRDLERAAELIESFRHDPGREAQFERLRARYSTRGDRAEALVDALAALQIVSGSQLQRGLALDLSGWDDPKRLPKLLGETTRSHPVLERRLRSTVLGGVATATFTATRLAQLARSDYELRRLLARAALKLADIPERVVAADTGTPTLEHLDGETWRALDLGAPRETGEVAP